MKSIFALLVLMTLGAPADATTQWCKELYRSCQVGSKTCAKKSLDCQLSDGDKAKAVCADATQCNNEVIAICKRATRCVGVDYKKK